MTDEEFIHIGLPSKQEILDRSNASELKDYASGAFWMRGMAAREIIRLRRTQPRRVVIDQLTLRTAEAIEKEKEVLQELAELKESEKTLVDRACGSFCKRCVHNQTIKKCMYLEKDCPLIGAFRKDLEE